jgi:hypothetical protein
MQFQPSCIFLELEATFFKRYCTVQNDEHVSMALRVIKQGYDEKLDIYYERILKFVTIFNIKWTTTC